MSYTTPRYLVALAWSNFENRRCWISAKACANWEEGNKP